MAARSTMAYIINILEKKVHDEGNAIWDAADLQDYLDMHRTHIRRRKLKKDVDEKLYFVEFGLLEGTYARSTDDDAAWDDDSTVIKIWDSASADATAATPDGWNLIDGRFWWDADQNEDYSLDAISYDLEGAIAECLEELAMDPDKAVRWSRGGVMYTHYHLLEMARYHRSLSGPKSQTLVRSYRT